MLPGRHSALKEPAPCSRVAKHFGMILQVARACVRNYMGSCKASQGSVTSSHASQETSQSPPDHQPPLWSAHCPASTLTKGHPQKPRPPIYVLREMGREPRGSVLSHVPTSVNKKGLTERKQTQTLPQAAY